MVVLGIVISLYCFIKAQKKIEAKKELTHKSVITYFLVSIMVLPIAYFTKEPSLALVLVSLSMLGVFYSKGEDQKNRMFIFYFLANCFWGIMTMALGFFFGPASIKTGYASAYKISLGKMFQNIGKYFTMLYSTYNLLLPLTGIAFLVYVIVRLYQKNSLCFRSKWLIVMLVNFFSFLLIQSPWGYVLPRYLLPCIVTLSIFMGLEVNRVFDFLRGLSYPKAKVASQMVLLIVTLLFVYPNMMDTYYFANWYLAHETVNSRMIDFLAHNTPANGNVYMNLNCTETNEWYIETILHFRVFYDRKDIRVRCLAPKPTGKVMPGDLIVTWSRMKAYPENVIAKVLGINGMEGINIFKDANERFYWKVFRVN